MRKLVAIAALVLLSACARTVPPLNFSVPNVGPSAVRIPAEVRSITISMARAGEEIGQPLPAGLETVVPLWKTALEEALNKMSIFQDDAPKRVSIAVKIIQFDVPTAGFTMTTSAIARYEIIDRGTGAVIHTADIASSGTTPTDFAWLAIARVRESVNRAVTSNITQFLGTLDKVNVNQPMIPGAVQRPAAGSPARNS